MDAFYTGNEHGLIAAEYFSDDEYLADVADHDEAAYRAWLEDEGAAAGAGVYRPARGATEGAGASPRRLGGPVDHGGAKAERARHRPAPTAAERSGGGCAARIRCARLLGQVLKQLVVEDVPAGVRHGPAATRGPADGPIVVVHPSLGGGEPPVSRYERRRVSLHHSLDRHGLGVRRWHPRPMRPPRR